ncbi:MAG: glutamate--tRNA ligase, partial [Candidatus Hydrothermae bacterium]|nr:glutamate--tRNA ligase [Candidatus Hydrothermae bacterium]
GFPTYHLANVVDDHEMGITHVMRADEWIPSTPYHVILYRAFGWDPPEFAHLPVILSPDGKGKLSKRHGATSVREFQKAGYLPEALVNFLALLGWSPGDDRELLSREELIHLFDLDRVGTRPVHFDYKKLEWMNGEYIRKTPDEQLLEEVRKRARAHGLVADEEDLRRMIPLLKERVRTLEQFIEYGIYFFRDPETYDPKGVRKHFQPPEEVIPRLEALKSRWEALPEWTEEALEHSLRELAEELQVKAGKLIHPVRLSLTGFTVGPSLFALVEALGRERTLRRLETAIQRLKEGRVEVHNAS